MNDHIVVSPFSETIFDQFHRKKFVVNTTHIESVLDINQAVNSRNELHAIRVDSKLPLGDIVFQESWRGVPIALYAPEMGPFKNVITQLELLRKLNIRVFFSSAHPQFSTELTILSSLGIACGVYFDDSIIDWEGMNDLMHYAIYSPSSHAPLEPFQYIVSNCEPLSGIDFSPVYFNNPSKYIHIDENEQIAFTRESLDRGEYCAKGASSIHDVLQTQAYQSQLVQWQEHFLDFNTCSSCPTWRLCQGKFSDSKDKDTGCRMFFSNMLDAAEHYTLKTENVRNRIWQL